MVRMTIGFIGLGHMGSAVAENLLKSGRELRVWNRSPGPVDALVAKGARKAETPAAAFQAEVVFSMLTEDSVVEEVILASGALDGARAGTIHVNLATISVALAKRLEDLHRRQGVSYVGAPVLGRPDVAAAGELNVLVAGEAGAVDRIRPLLDLFAKAVWQLGEAPHRANVVKLACNFALASVIETLGEAGALAKAYGIEPSALYEVMIGSAFAAPAYKIYAPLVAEQRFPPGGFKLPLGLKDVRLALQAGESEHVPLPLASLLRDHFIEAIASGDGDLDWSALSRVSFRKAGL
jgi:3-hydroxyisobutyrate dehydrogenase-like beta-hydroxyacid dehydrogenase